MSVLVVQLDDESGPGSLELPLREAGVDLRFWFPHHDEDPVTPDVARHQGVLMLGGRPDPGGADEPEWMARAVDVATAAMRLDKPFLGVCLGAQVLSRAAGGTVTEALPDELGWTPLRVDASAGEDPLFGDLADGCSVFQWHTWSLDPPGDVEVLACTDAAPQAFRARGRQAWGAQFHLEIELATAALWCVKGRDELRDAGIEPAELRTQTAERVGAAEEYAGEVARRFAGLL